MNDSRRTPDIKSRKMPSIDLLREVVERNAGIGTLIAKACGVDPSTVLRWRKKSGKVEAMFQAVKEMNLDLAESKVMQAIQAGKTAECLFFLKCHGKSRGWIERQEIEQIGPSTVREELEKEKQRLKNPKYREAIRAFYAAVEEVDRSEHEQLKARTAARKDNVVQLPPRVVE